MLLYEGLHTRAGKRRRHRKLCCHARETNESTLLDQSKPLSLAIILLAGALPVLADCIAAIIRHRPTPARQTARAEHP